MSTCNSESKSQKATEGLAAKIGKRLKGGEVIELVSDLGGGKTAFVRGLAKGIGSDDLVGSPTFTISREYKAGDKTLYHFDFYRLDNPGIISDELAEVIGDPKSVVAVEWSDIVKHVLPDKRLTVTFKITGEDRRELEFSCPKELDYLLSDVIPGSIVDPEKKNRKTKILDSGSSPE